MHDMPLFALKCVCSALVAEEVTRFDQSTRLITCAENGKNGSRHKLVQSPMMYCQQRWLLRMLLNAATMTTLTATTVAASCLK